MKSRQQTDQLLRRAVDDGWHLPDDVADTVRRFDSVTRQHAEITPPDVPPDSELTARIEAGEPFDQVLADAEAAETAAARAKRARELLSGLRYQLRSILGEKLLVDNADEFLAEADRRARELLADLADHAALLAEFAPDYDPGTILRDGTTKQRTAAARIAERSGELLHILDMYADVVGTVARATKHPAPRALTVAVKPLAGATVWEDGGPDTTVDVRELPVAALVVAAAEHTFRLASIEQLTGKLRVSDSASKLWKSGGDPRQGVGDSIAARLAPNPNVPNDMTYDEASKFRAEVYGIRQPPAEEKSPADLAAEVAEVVKNDGRRK